MWLIDAIYPPKLGGYLTFQSNFWSWKPNNLDFYMMEVVNFDLLSFGDFLFTLYLCMWEFWRATFGSLWTQRWNSLYKYMPTLPTLLHAPLQRLWQEECTSFRFLDKKVVPKKLSGLLLSLPKMDWKMILNK